MHYQLERNHGCRVSDAWSYRGLKTAVMENDLLRIVVLVDKGADIYQFVHKPTDTDFLWRSPWGVRDPSKFLPTTGSGSFMDTYEGGWQTVLPGGGDPSQYQGGDLGLHAEVSTMPWDCVITEDTQDRVSIKFWVRTYRMPFYFEKTLTLDAGSTVLHIDQAITNEGEEPAYCVWGEHIALGAPFLSDDCVIDLPDGTIINHPTNFHPNSRLKPGIQSSWPDTEGIDGSKIDLSRVPPKSIRAFDISYIADMSDGWYAVTNRSREVGFGVRYSKDIYRYLWYWQAFGGGFGYPWYGRTYNVGLEPFTSYTNQGLSTAIENGTAMRLEAGERRESTFKAVAYVGSGPVTKVSGDGTVTFG